MNSEAPGIKKEGVIGVEYNDSQDRLSRNNRVLFPLVTVATLRVSLNKRTHQQLSVILHDPQTNEWVEQSVGVQHNEDLGLPNPTDEEVMLGLIDFRRGKPPGPFTFTLSDFIQHLHWRTWSWSERRIQQSLRVWDSLRLTFGQGRGDADGSIFLTESLCIFGRCELSGGTCDLAWSPPVVKALASTRFEFNFREYQSFRNALARRIYLFTEKQLRQNGTVSFHLREFAEKYLRLRCGYPLGHIRRKLKKALAELERRKYIRPAQLWDRFPFQRDGTPTLHLAAGSMLRAPRKRQEQMELSFEAPQPKTSAQVIEHLEGGSKQLSLAN